MALASIFCASALAQSADDGSQLQEVLVTAQRSSALESKTPVAMSVLSGEQLRRAGLDSPAELAARLPNVHLDNAADGLRITIRGVSNSDTTEKGDPSAAFLLDGVYLARPQIQNLSFYDLERVEVLRGPQGTLYGRNATAGVINVISKQPVQQFEGAAGIELGNYSSRKATAMLNVPISPALAVRAALAYNKHDSYLINGQGTGYRLGLDRDDLSLRLSARLTIGQSATLLLRYDHSRVDDNNDSFVPDGNFYTGVGSGRPRPNHASTDQHLTNGFMAPNGRPEQGVGSKKTDGISAELDYRLGPVTLSYLGSRRNFTNDFLTNYYYRVAPAFALGVRQTFSGSYDQDSHELRLASNGSGPLTAQAGIYYFREQSRQRYSFRDLELIDLTPYYVFSNDPTEARSRAVFGQASYRLADRLRATAGARFTDDDKSRVGSTNFQQGAVFNPATDFQQLNSASLSTHKSTWKLGAEYDLAAATLLYATLSTGYKSGGFNDGCATGSHSGHIGCPASTGLPSSALLYQPETLSSREVGLKTRFWNNKASLDLAAFDYDYKNLQLSGVAIVGGAPRFLTTNAGVASVRGLEAEGQLQLTPFDRFNYGLSLLDAHYVSYMPDAVHSWAGDKLDRAPSHVFSLGYERRFLLPGGQVTAGLSARKSADYVIAVPSKLLQYRVAPGTESDASLAWQPDGGRWSMRALVKNISDKVHPISIDSFGMLVPSAPRTASLRFDYKF